VLYLANTSGTMNILAHTGDPAPGGETFGSFYLLNTVAALPRLSSDNQVAFTATTSSGSGYYVGGLGGITKWISVGAPIPGRPGLYVDPNANSLPDALVSGGRMLLHVSTDRTTSNNVLLFGAAGDIHTLAALGDAAPGLPG